MAFEKIQTYNIRKTRTINDFSPKVVSETKNTQTCPVCGRSEFVHDSSRAEVSCGYCGAVIDESIIDEGPGIVAYDKEQRDKRTTFGPPVTNMVSDNGLTTTIDNRNKDARGNRLPQNNIKQIHRIKELNKRNRISRAGERNLAIALTELARETSKLAVPKSIRVEAASIYRKAAKNNLIRGRSIDVVVSTSIYIACRVCNLPRTLDEVAEVSKVTKGDIGRTHRFLVKELNIVLPQTSPVDLIPRFASRLGVSGEAESKAIEIIHDASDKGLTTGKTPNGIAAAALYIASVLKGEKKTQRAVAEATNVTEVTIRNTYKTFSEKLELVVWLIIF